MPAPIYLRDRQPRMPFSPLQTGGSIRLREPVAAALMLTTALLVGLAANPSQAQSDYPRTTIRFIVPQAAGGSTDLVAREIGARISPALGQSIVIENRAGANGIIGTELAMKAKPDGYTMLVGGTGTLAINPSLYPKLPYDPARDFTPVAMFGYSTSVLVTHPSVPARNIAELIDWIKASSKPVLYGSAGIGSSPHLTAEMFRDMAKVNIEHVPYKGSTRCLRSRPPTSPACLASRRPSGSDSSPPPARRPPSCSGSMPRSTGCWSPTRPSPGS
jgi:tripartite-type tricarboxylate transporter receptor subunit TctC